MPSHISSVRAAAVQSQYNSHELKAETQTYTHAFLLSNERKLHPEHIDFTSQLSGIQGVCLNSRFRLVIPKGTEDHHNIQAFFRSMNRHPNTTDLLLRQRDSDAIKGFFRLVQLDVISVFVPNQPDAQMDWAALLAEKLTEKELRGEIFTLKFYLQNLKHTNCDFNRAVSKSIEKNNMPFIDALQVNRVGLHATDMHRNTVMHALFKYEKHIDFKIFFDDFMSYAKTNALQLLDKNNQGKRPLDYLKPEWHTMFLKKLNALYSHEASSHFGKDKAWTAHCVLGLMYSHGLILQRSRKEGAAYFNAAIKHRACPQSSYIVGVEFLSDSMSYAKREEGKALIKDAAEKGVPLALFKRGSLFAVKGSEEKGRKYFGLAAQAGLAQAFHAIARYSSQTSPEASTDYFYELHESAALQGFTASQLVLASFYEKQALAALKLPSRDERQVRADFGKAGRWYTLVQTNGTSEEVTSAIKKRVALYRNEETAPYFENSKLESNRLVADSPSFDDPAEKIQANLNVLRLLSKVEQTVETVDESIKRSSLVVQPILSGPTKKAEDDPLLKEILLLLPDHLNEKQAAEIQLLRSNIKSSLDKPNAENHSFFGGFHRIKTRRWGATQS